MAMPPAAGGLLAQRSEQNGYYSAYWRVLTGGSDPTYNWSGLK